jgi:tRNA dimethylallyltransferase
LPEQPKLIAIFGPTGIGKTAVAVALGELLRARGEHPVAISADALQVYEGLETLTGAATASERSRLEHRLLGFVPVDRTFSVGEFMPLAHKEIDDALAAGRRPIVVGGTGLYLRAALTELDLRPPPPPELRRRWERELEIRGPEALYAELLRRAPLAASEVDPGDRSRVVRLLELLDMGEEVEPPSDRENQLWTTDTRHPTLLAGLVMEREQLYARIDERADAIAAGGGIEEVKRADASGASATARKALGFDELLAGDVETMKRRTRNYARRQLTWMRKLPNVELIDVTGRRPEVVAQQIAGLAGGDSRRNWHAAYRVVGGINRADLEISLAGAAPGAEADVRRLYEETRAHWDESFFAIEDIFEVPGLLLVLGRWRRSGTEPGIAFGFVFEIRDTKVARARGYLGYEDAEAEFWSLAGS